MKDFELVKNAVTDIDGNVYDAVKIGKKLWLASNLRVTRLNDGTLLGGYVESELGKLPYFEYPFDLTSKSSKLSKYGLHYNFEAVNTGLLAPEGWRVTEIKDWTELLTFLGNGEHNQSKDEKRPYLAHTAKALCSNNDWLKSDVEHSVGCNQKENNATGLNIYPNGYSINVKNPIGVLAYLWCSDVYPDNDEYTWFVRIWHKGANVVGAFGARALAMGVRCIKCL
ncbi:MAG: fibrobacter succinogenes major paralogous domain-containing protein [Alphaproteobacteria bacterium]|nr:fibrobacter succinogenes major paralogous domain-containing protein [Alphaproteobacteria bacterium]